jgi:hypothetical protein
MRGEINDRPNAASCSWIEIGGGGGGGGSGEGGIREEWNMLFRLLNISIIVNQ